LTVAVQLATAARLPKKKTPRRSRDMRVSFFKVSPFVDVYMFALARKSTVSGKAAAEMLR